MRLINKCEKDTAEYVAADAALQEHYEKFGKFARRQRDVIYRVKVTTGIVTIQIHSTLTSYTAFSCNRVRELQRVWGAN